MNTNLKQRMQTRLKEVRLTQAELASRLGLKNPQNVTGWFKRERIPYEWLYQIAEMLECDPDWLQNGIGSETPSDKRLTTVDPAALAVVIAGTIEAVKEVGLDWDSAQIARLAAQLYALWEDTGEHANFPQAARLSSLQR